MFIIGHHIPGGPRIRSPLKASNPVTNGEALLAAVSDQPRS